MTDAETALIEGVLCHYQHMRWDSSDELMALAYAVMRERCNPDDITAYRHANEMYNAANEAVREAGAKLPRLMRCKEAMQ